MTVVGLAGVPVPVYHQLLLGLALLHVVIADRDLLLLRSLREELPQLHRDQPQGQWDRGHCGGRDRNDGWN